MSDDPKPSSLATLGARSLTPELAEVILQCVKDVGAFKGPTARMCGIDPDVLNEWIRAGLTPGAPELYSNFARAYVAEEAYLQSEALRCLRAHAKIDPKAALSYLAARFPDEYGAKPTQVEQADRLQPDQQDLDAEEEIVSQLLESGALDGVLRKLGKELVEVKK